MFEDFKEKVGILQNKAESKIHITSTVLEAEITENLMKAGIDPIMLQYSKYFQKPWTPIETTNS
jgi:hypothetical protein